MKKRRNGVLTVEAALILPVFIMVMVFVLNLMNLFYFHLVMQQAVSNAGRSLAQYGYIIDKTIGISNLALDASVSSKEKKVMQDVDELVTSAGEFAGLLQGKLTLDTIGQIIQKGEEFKQTLESAGKTISSISKEEIVNYLLVSAMNGADDVFMQWMIGDYLKETGALIGNIDEIEYAVYVEKETKDFIFVVQYRYSLPFSFFKEVYLQQTLRIHPWVGGNTKGAFQ